MFIQRQSGGKGPLQMDYFGKDVWALIIERVPRGHRVNLLCTCRALLTLALTRVWQPWKVYRFALTMTMEPGSYTAQLTVCGLFHAIEHGHDGYYLHWRAFAGKRWNPRVNGGAIVRMVMKQNASPRLVECVLAEPMLKRHIEQVFIEQIKGLSFFTPTFGPSYRESMLAVINSPVFKRLYSGERVPKIWTRHPFRQLALHYYVCHRAHFLDEYTRLYPLNADDIFHVFEQCITLRVSKYEHNERNERLKNVFYCLIISTLEKT